MSAPIRPIDNDSKFLQSKKKIRKKKILRERDEINECDEDDFDEQTLKLNTTNNRNTLAAAAAGGPRSRSVLGGACDIETLVSLLSSGGSDSEKEDANPTNGADPTGNGSSNFNINISSALKSRAPMLKKTGKSVSFQESELKQSAGLNRDYYQPGHRKPPSLQPFANRIRRSQQLANTLNAFQKKNLTEDTKSDDDRDQPSNDESKDNTNAPKSIPPSSNPTKTVQAASPPASDAKTGETGQDGTKLADGQTPKEQECYRLFQKMSNMGLSVSYDTILRGMLTPTELRVLQKQRTKLAKQQESSRQNSSETEKEHDSTSDRSKSERTASASDLSSLLGSEPELVVPVSDPLPVLAEQTVE